MDHFLEPSGIKTVLPFSYGIKTFACLSSTTNYDVQVPSLNNVYCALYSRMICWLGTQSMMICLHIFRYSFTRVSWLQNCRFLSIYHSEWIVHWEWRMVGRPTSQCELLQGFLWYDNRWRYLCVFLFCFVFKCWFFSLLFKLPGFL